MRLTRRLALATILCTTALAAPAAQAVTVQTFSTLQSPFTPGTRNQGWWSPSIVPFRSNGNYIVQAGFFHDFFSFDLASACAPVAATLRLTRFNQTAPLEFSLWDVSTPAATLNLARGPNQAIYDDLGSGTRFGGFPVATGAPTDVLSFRLNAAGVAAVGAARGGFFSIGGSSGGPDTQWLFGFSGPPASGVQELALTCAPVSKDECKDGAWRDFGVFRNQGDCVSHVATGGRNGARA
jgi:hypothetical protein